MAQYYDGYDWDVDGFPGEYVYGDRYYIDDFYKDARWKPIYDYPGYWISNKGQVYGPGRHGYGQFLTPTPDRTNHLYVTLVNEHGKRKAYVHHLMAEAFIPNYQNAPMVRHLDDIPDHNEDLGNLAWGTAYDNVHDSIRNGTALCLRQRIPIQVKDLMTGETWTFESQAEAARFLEISPTSIGRVLARKQDHANGYTFAYIDEDINDRSVKTRRNRYAKVLATNLKTGEQMVFDNQQIAERELGIGSRMINRVLLGHRPYTHGYSFEYIFERGARRGD